MLNEGGKVSDLWEHSVELLQRLRTVFFALIASVVVVLVFPIDLTSFSFENPQYLTITTFIINKLRSDFLPSGTELIPVSWTSSIEVYFYVSLILGIVLSSPVIAYEVYKFITPALYRSERKQVMYFVIAFVALFGFGFFMGYYMVTPAMMRIFVLSTEPFGILKIYEFAQFFSIIMTSLLICGIIMTTPLFLFILLKTGFVQVESYKKVRKYVYGAILIVIALLDPDPTLITELFLGIPLIVILEITIIIGGVVKRHAASKDEQHVTLH